MAIVVLLDTTDVSAYLVDQSVKWGPLDLATKIPTASFSLKAGTPKIPIDDMYVKITDTDGTTVLFAGVVRQPKEFHHPYKNFQQYDAACQGWGALLKQVLVADTLTYSSVSDRYIFADLLSRYYGQIATSVTHSLYPKQQQLSISFVAGQSTLYDALDAVASLGGGLRWWIDLNKGVHLNDYQAMAPVVLGDQPNGTTIKGHRGIEFFRDSVTRPGRIIVNGAGGATYTAIDWVAVANANRRSAQEPGSPNLRYFDLPTVTDTNISTNADCAIEAWGKLAEAGSSGQFPDLPATAPRDVITITTDVAGLTPGQRVDVIDSKMGTKTHPYVHASGRGPRGWSASRKLHTELGRFRIIRVNPEPLPKQQGWRSTVDVGEIEPSFAGFLGTVKTN